jgi:hypothetical protein
MLVKLLPMQGNLIRALVLAIVLAGGCSRPETQKTVASRLAQADRVIVLNPRDGVTMMLQGEQLKKVVGAIEASEKVSHGEMLSATPGYALVFFKSREHLATVATGAEIVFYIDKKAYHDKSGTLLEVMKRFWMTHPDSR